MKLRAPPPRLQACIMVKCRVCLYRCAGVCVCACVFVCVCLCVLVCYLFLCVFILCSPRNSFPPSDAIDHDIHEAYTHECVCVMRYIHMRVRVCVCLHAMSTIMK